MVIRRVMGGGEVWSGIMAGVVVRNDEMNILSFKFHSHRYSFPFARTLASTNKPKISIAKELLAL